MFLSFLRSQRTITALCLATVFSTGCSLTSKKIDHAHEIAQQVQLSHAYIQASPFILSSWQKVKAPGDIVHVYIEGDGRAWLSRTTPSHNPTPNNPVGLVLAASDTVPNVVYIARPCQYTPLDMRGNNCSRDYWMGKRFSVEAINSYHAALDQLSALYNAPGFHLIGYSGGANIAGLLAAERDDILSLRTVAGNVDNDFFTQFHGVSTMPLSLNMADHAHKSLRFVPQYHFIAEKDKFVPPDIFQSYAQKLSPSACVQSETVPHTTHANGWGERWRALLSKAPRCSQ